MQSSTAAGAHFLFANQIVCYSNLRTCTVRPQLLQLCGASLGVRARWPIAETVAETRTEAEAEAESEAEAREMRKFPVGGEQATAKWSTHAAIASV